MNEHLRQVMEQSRIVYEAYARYERETAELRAILANSPRLRTPDLYDLLAPEEDRPTQ